MSKLELVESLHSIRKIFIVALCSFPLACYASFIESTIGTAVINDATAGYFNPAALTLLKNPQFIALGSVAFTQSQFNGEFLQKSTGYTQSGVSHTNSTFYLPSVYLGIPLTPHVTGGLAVVANDFNRDLEGYSILRYVQSSNKVQDIDLIPSIGLNINEFVAIGAGLNFSTAEFIMQPTSGLPSLNIPDSVSHNVTHGTGWGGDLGLLLKPGKSTLMGFNYRSSINYQLVGSSSIESHPNITSYNYHFNFWTPARSVFSITHWVTPRLGLLATVQYIEWSIFKEIDIYNLVTRVGRQVAIVPKVDVPYHFHNSWHGTLGGHYRINPAFVLRFATSYVESPSDGNYQVDTGDSVIVGASMGYNINKDMMIDGSYAHSFTLDQNINISNARNLIQGVNHAAGDSVSVKLTLTF